MIPAKRVFPAMALLALASIGAVDGVPDLSDVPRLRDFRPQPYYPPREPKPREYPENERRTLDAAEAKRARKAAKRVRDDARREAGRARQAAPRSG